MREDIVLSVWVIGLNLAMWPIYLVISAYSPTIYAFSLVTFVLFAAPLALIIMRYLKYIELNLAIIVSLTGTALLWWPIFEDGRTKFLDSPSSSTQLIVTTSMFGGLAALIASAFVPWLREKFDRNHSDNKWR